jgi:hypothetical protein
MMEPVPVLEYVLSTTVPLHVERMAGPDDDPDDELLVVGEAVQPSININRTKTGTT